MTAAPGSPGEIARRLAETLDREDYPAAHALLAPDCHYTLRGESLVGPEAIVASYRKNAEDGRQRFDQLVFESEVTILGPSEARIGYTDRLTRAGYTHVHRCAQLVRWNEAGLISRITHCDLPGEREALEAFLAEHP